MFDRIYLASRSLPGRHDNTCWLCLKCFVMYGYVDCMPHVWRKGHEYRHTDYSHPL